MNRARTRWILASAIGLLSVVQALRTLPSLSSHAPLGAAALLALALLTVAGLVSLWNARRRVERELVGLAQRPSRGELVDARRARLAEIAAGGGKPDLSTLAEATAANERGQAYLGRYLVAVAVLIGLIGTFAGLAEALRALPSILGGASDPQKLASLLSVPLAGLDVVFAAGIVGILSTLALSLAQGDLQLAEDGMLARLEEETTHELIPALWPRTHSVEERMLRELAQIREENRTLLIEVSGAIGTRVAEVTARTITDLGGRLTSAVEASTSKLAADVQRGFTDAMRAHGEASTTLRIDGAAQLAALKQSGESLVQLATRSASALEARLATEAGHIASALERTHTAQQHLADALRSAAEHSALVVGEQLGHLGAQLAEQSIATQHILVDSATASGKVAAAAVESLRAELVSSLGAVRDGLVAELSGARIELGASLYAATDALRGEASSARTALDQSAARAIDAMGRSVTSVASIVTDVSQAVSVQAAAAAALISESAARAQDSLATSTASAQRAMLDGLSQAQHAIADGSTLAQLAMAEGVSEAKLAIVAGATQVNGVLADSIARAEKTLSDGALVLSSAASEELSATRLALVEATQGAHGALAAALETALARLDTLLSTSRTELGDTLVASRDAVDRLVTDSVGSLSSSAGLLASAADTMSRANDQLGPQLEALTPELRLLGQELALLGARTEQTDEPLFADELVRLGEGMERLEALVRLAQSHGESAQS